MNVFTAIGRVGRDAKVRYTQGGDAVAGWSLAVESGYGDKKATTWLDCSLWGKRAEKVAEHIRKGDRLGVVGEISTREHDGKTYVTLKVSDVTLLGEKRASNGPSPNNARSRQAPAEGDDFGTDPIPF